MKSIPYDRLESHCKELVNAAQLRRVILRLANSVVGFTPRFAARCCGQSVERVRRICARLVVEGKIDGYARYGECYFKISTGRGENSGNGLL